MTDRGVRSLSALVALLVGVAAGYAVGELAHRAESARLQQKIRHLEEHEQSSRQRMEVLRREADRLREKLGIDQAPYTNGGPSDDR